MPKTTEWSVYVLEESAAWGHDRLVLLCMSMYADGEGEAYPGVDGLSELANLSAPVVVKCLRNLIANGDIELIQQGTRSRAATYRILHGPNATSRRAAPKDAVAEAPAGLPFDDAETTPIAWPAPAKASAEEPEEIDPGAIWDSHRRKFEITPRQFLDNRPDGYWSRYIDASFSWTDFEAAMKVRYPERFKEPGDLFFAIKDRMEPNPNRGRRDYSTAVVNLDAEPILSWRTATEDELYQPKRKQADAADE